MIAWAIRGATAVLLLHAALAAAQPEVPPGEPAVDPRDWRGEVDGPLSRILTVGMPHLSQLSPAPTPAMLEPLIARLMAYRPAIVTYEGLPGEQCEALRETPVLYDGAAESYCWDRAEITAPGLPSVGEARISIAATLATWPETPTAEQRRSLAAAFLAANDRASALVQWLQLASEERRAAGALTPAMAEVLTGVAARMNESYAVAAVVAARLGHARVHAVDDHSADAVLAAAPSQCSDAIGRMWASPAAAALMRVESTMQAGITDGEALLAYVRHANRAETLRAYMAVDHRAAVGGGGAGECGRRYVAWWEARNLRMAANVRAAAGTQPGARVLNIVGASHKPYYDLLLSMLADAGIADAEAVLR